MTYGFRPAILNECLDCPPALQGPGGSNGNDIHDCTNSQPSVHLQQHAEGKVNARDSDVAVLNDSCSVIGQLRMFYVQSLLTFLS